MEFSISWPFTIMISAFSMEKGVSNEGRLYSLDLFQGVNKVDKDQLTRSCEFLLHVISLLTPNRESHLHPV